MGPARRPGRRGSAGTDRRRGTTRRSALRISSGTGGEFLSQRGAVKPLNLQKRLKGSAPMATTATAPERKVSAEEAREVAEAAREKEWVAPSFVRELFLGTLRMDLVHPYPEQDADEERRAQPFLTALARLLREVDSDRIDREGEIPDHIIEGLRSL